MFEGPVTGNIPEVLDNGEVLTARTSPQGSWPWLSPRTQAGLKAGQQRAGAGNCALTTAALTTTDGQVAPRTEETLDSSHRVPDWGGEAQHPVHNPVVCEGMDFCADL